MTTPERTDPTPSPPPLARTLAALNAYRRLEFGNPVVSEILSAASALADTVDVLVAGMTARRKGPTMSMLDDVVSALTGVPTPGSGADALTDAGFTVKISDNRLVIESGAVHAMFLRERIGAMGVTRPRWVIWAGVDMQSRTVVPGWT